MNLMKLFVFNSLVIMAMSCGDSAGKNNKLFEIQLSGSEFKKGETIAITIKNKEHRNIEAIAYSIGGQDLPLNNGNIVLDIDHLGNKTLKAKIAHDGTTTEVSKSLRVLAPAAPEIYTYEILNEFPHDIKAYTQGLEFHNGVLYESTGQKGRSSLRKLDFMTGKVLQQIDLDPTYFGEGLTILNDKVYQLTWQNGTGFIYNLEDLQKIDNFKYGNSKEGWGLANDGQNLYKSDGTEKIWLLDPETLVEKEYIETVTDRSIFNKANELEYVDGKLYANVYQKESMMIINAKSGAIEGVINFGGLKEKVTQHELLDVLNGVAYHPDRKTFFVTGKNWDKMFEVNIIKKE
jgi:glutamine cyclotransferase